MTYVDGFVLAVPKKKLKEYAKMAKKAGKIWRDHGALDFRECVGEDLKVRGMLSFPKMIKTKAGEQVLFSYIVFKSRSHRDRVNKKVMKDPRLDNMMGAQEMPFDMKRMAYGGFKTLVKV